MGGGLLALVGAECALLFVLSSRSPAPSASPNPRIVAGPTAVPKPLEEVYVAPGSTPPPDTVPLVGGTGIGNLPPAPLSPNGKTGTSLLPVPSATNSLLSALPPAPGGKNPPASNPKLALAAQKFDQASAALKSGNKKGAVALWEEVVKLAPKDVATRQNLALVYAQLNQPKEALLHSRAAVQIAPSDPKNQFQLARLLLGTKQIKAALVPLRETVRLAPQERDGHALLARALVDAGQPKEAFAQWTYLAQHNGHDIEAHLMAAGVASQVLRNRSEAGKWLRQGHAQNPKSPDLSIELARFLMGGRDFKGAASVLQQGVAATPNAFALYPALATALTAAKDRPGAIKAMQGALARVPKGVKGASDLEGSLRVTLGKLYGDGKQPALARDQFLRAAQLLPRDPEPLAMAALAQIDLKDLSGATKSLSGAAKIDPKNPRVRLMYAQTLAQNKQWKEADSQYETYCAAVPRDKESLFQWARVANALKNPDREAVALKRLITLVPRDPGLWRQLSSAQLAGGDKSEALQSLQKAVALEPRDLPVVLEVADMQSAAGNARGAMTTLQKALNSRPDYAPLYFLYLQAGDAAKEKEEARDLIAQKLANQPQNGAALSGALKFYDDKKRRDDARALLNAIIARNPKATLAKNALATYEPTATTTEPTKAP